MQKQFLLLTCSKQNLIDEPPKLNGLLIIIAEYNACKKIYMKQVQTYPMAKKYHSFDITQLSSQMSYFFIYSYSFDLKSKPAVKDIQPFMVTFRDDSITFVEIMNRYLKLNPTEKRINKTLAFTLPVGSIINPTMTVKKLKKQLRRDSVAGLNLFVRDAPQQKPEMMENSAYKDECGLMDFITQQYFDREKEFLFHFILPKSRYIITINIHPGQKVSVLLDKFVKHISTHYKQTLSPKSFKDITNNQIKDYILVSSNTSLSRLKDKQKTIHECPLFNNGDLINVLMNNPNFIFAKIIKDDFQITLISKDNQTLKSKIMTIRYDQITDFTVQNLYKVYFLNQEQRKIFDVETKQNKICLKVLEYILSPDETLMDIDKAIQKVKTLGSFKLVAYFVTQKMIFYQQMRKISENYEFQLKHLKLVQDSSNKDLIKKCETNSQKFVSDRIVALQHLTVQKYFQTPKQALPIVVYSSELKIKNEENQPEQPVYYSLNKWLRLNSILKAKVQQMQHWCYRFTSILFKHLSMIKNIQQNLYRGVTYQLQAKPNDKIMFKNFLSTTLDRNVAIRFAIGRQTQKRYQEPDSPLLPLVLYNIKASQGKSIQHFSLYPEQKEYLFEPYSQFRLITKREQIINFPTMQRQNHTFIVYDMQEIVTPKKMPQTINNYIVWVDDKPFEGELIYNQLISRFLYPTVLFQIRSTKDLETWINERSVIINDKTKKMIMITNMVRKEEDKLNYYAGVDAINLANTLITPNIPIALYVGNLQSAINNLAQKQCDFPKQNVMNTFERLSEYVGSKIGVKFRQSDQDVLQQVIVDKVSNGNNGVYSSSTCEFM